MPQSERERWLREREILYLRQAQGAAGALLLPVCVAHTPILHTHTTHTHTNIHTQERMRGSVAWRGGAGGTHTHGCARR